MTQNMVHKGITYHQSKVSKMIKWTFINMFELKKIESTKGSSINDLKYRRHNQPNNCSMIRQKRRTKIKIEIGPKVKC